jgi:hypothetical protein
MSFKTELENYRQKNHYGAAELHAIAQTLQGELNDYLQTHQGYPSINVTPDEDTNELRVDVSQLQAAALFEDYVSTVAPRLVYDTTPDADTAHILLDEQRDYTERGVDDIVFNIREAIRTGGISVQRADRESGGLRNGDEVVIDVDRSDREDNIFFISAEHVTPHAAIFFNSDGLMVLPCAVSEYIYVGPGED